MIANRIFLSPLWLQGVVRGALAAAFLSAVLAFMYPTFVDRASLPLAALAVIALAAIATGATIYIGLPARRHSLQALDGLDRTRSLAALDALRTGQVPTDREVLAAAVRTGILAQAYRRNVGRRTRAALWAFPAVLIIAGVVELFRLPPTFGGFAIAVGVCLLSQRLNLLRRRRRTDASMRVLCAADPQTASEDVVAVPPVRFGRAAAVVVVAVTAFMAFVVTVATPSQDCRVAGSAVNLIYDNSKLSNPRNSEATLAAYRSWSTQLRAAADRASDPSVAPRLHKIADLAADALSQVEQARGGTDAQPPQGYTPEQDKAFDATVQALYKEDSAVADLCFPHH